MLALFIFLTATFGYICLLVIFTVLTKNDYLINLRFSVKKYYLLMGWVPFSFLVLTLFLDSRYLVFFFVCGAAGIIGETVVSMIWSRVFDQSIWTYHHLSRINGYTSALNFLPWATGAFIFLITARLLETMSFKIFNVDYSPYGVSGLAFVSGIILAVLLVVWHTKHTGDEKQFTMGRFLIFCVPIVTTALALCVFCDLKFLILLLAFAVIGNITEYIYGKIINLLFGQCLWTYTYLKIDSGHSSFVNLPLWALGGLYFYLISISLGLVA